MCMNKKIAFIMAHPSDVYLFRFLIEKLKGQGHECIIFVRERERIVKYLLNYYGLKYIEITPAKYSMFSRAIYLIKTDVVLYKHLKKLKPDVLVGRVSPYFAHNNFLLKKYFIAFEDNELTSLNMLISLPFIDTVITPSSFKYNLGKKHIYVDSCKELAYLHPNYFTPNNDVYDELGIDKGEKYVILRFNAFDAYHDIGKRGLSIKEKHELVRELEKYAHVFISSEIKLPNKLKKYEVKLPDLHSALYYAHLHVSDTVTTPVESAILGTPTLRYTPNPKNKDVGLLMEMEKKYKLLYNYNDFNTLLDATINIVKRDDVKRIWEKRRDRFLEDKLDLTAFLVWFVRNYPESKLLLKQLRTFPRIEKKDLKKFLKQGEII